MVKPIKMLWCDDDDDFIKGVLAYFAQNDVLIDGRKVELDTLPSIIDAEFLENKIANYDVLILDIVGSSWGGYDAEAMMESSVKRLRIHFRGAIIFCSGIPGLNQFVDWMKGRTGDTQIDGIRLMDDVFGKLPALISNMLKIADEQ